MGRGRRGLTDPYLSRTCGKITREGEANGRRTGHSASPHLVPLSPAGLCPEDPAPLPSPRLFRRYKRGWKLQVHTSLSLGSGTWEVRPRPPTQEWPGGITRPTGGRTWRIGRVMMPIMALGFLMRWVGNLWVVGAMIAAALLVYGGYHVISRKRARAWDEARLLLTAHSCALSDPSSDRTTEAGQIRGATLDILHHPGKKRRLSLETGDGVIVATVGPHASAYAYWIAGQALVHGRRTRVVGVEEVDTDQKSTRFAGLTVTFGASISDIPPHVSRLLPAVEVGSPGWREAMERITLGSSPLPRQLSFSDLVGPPSRQNVHRRWREQGCSGVAVGQAMNGPTVISLENDGPHGLVVGGTGSGKSEFLTTMALAHALTYPPSHLRMVFLDFKGGAGLDHLASLPHVDHALSDLDAVAVPWLLRALGAALTLRKRQLNRAGMRSWDEWEVADHRGSAPGFPALPPRLLVIVDEFQVLAEKHPELMGELASIATQGRSLGLHLILASQRPSGALTPQMRSTIDLRVALRCSEGRDSQEVIGTDKAAQLPRIPGRALMGGQEIQAALVEDAPQWIEAIKDAWYLEKAEREHPDAIPIIPAPLPEVVEGRKGKWGVYEDPLEATVRPLPLTSASVAIIGPASHAEELADIARTVAVASPVTHSSHTPPALHIWMGEEPDMRSGDPALRLLQQGWDAVIPSQGLGGIARALTHLVRLLSEDHAHDAPPTVVINGLSSMLTRLEASAHPDRVMRLWEAVRSAARQGSLRLIVVDSKSRVELGDFPVRVVRIPSRGALLTPSLSAHLPTEIPGSGLPVIRPSDLARFASPIRGRVVITGLPEGAVWGQMAFLSEVSTPHICPPVQEKRGWSRDGPQFSPERPVIVLAPHPVLEELRRAFTAAPMKDRYSSRHSSPLPSLPHSAPLHPSFPRVSDLVATDRWATLVSADRPVIAVEPPPEWIRILAQRYPTDAVWIAACAPYTDGEGIVSMQGCVHYVDHHQMWEILAHLRAPASTGRAEDMSNLSQ